MTPSPKEKAEELIRKYYTFGINKEGQTLSWYESKQCAIIAVDEIINSSPTNPLKGGYIGLYSDMVDEAIEYYKEVKQELEKL
jgi:hypothetical protein